MNTTTSSLLDENAAAVYLALSPRTLQAWRLRGAGPVFVRLGGGERGAIRYRKDDLDSFITEGARRSTSEAVA